jgi:hypothetical protein
VALLAVACGEETKATPAAGDTATTGDTGVAGDATATTDAAGDATATDAASDTVAPPVDGTATAAGGGCTSKDDQAVLASWYDADKKPTKEQEEFSKATVECIDPTKGGAPCFGKSAGKERTDCVAACMKGKKVKTSDTCTVCFAGYADCSAAKCLNQCLGDSGKQECKDCQDKECKPAREACIAGK